VKDSKNCSSNEETVQIKLPKPVNLTVLDNQKIVRPESCNPNKDGSIQLPSNTYNYLWNENNPVYSATYKNDELQTGLMSGNYSVLVSNLDGTCEVPFEIHVGVANTVKVTITGDGSGEDRNYYCPDSELTLTGNLFFNNTPVAVSSTTFRAQWKWFSDGTFIDDFTPEEPTIDLTATDRTVQLSTSFDISDGKTCQNDTVFEIKTWEAPILVFEEDHIYIPEDETDELRMNITNWGTPGDSYEWISTLPGFNDPGDPRFPVTLHSPLPDQPYSLTLILTDENSCTARDAVTVERALKILIPNVFTPNGDLKNDEWKFRNLEQYTNHYRVQVAVFNRGGSMVFSSNDYTNDKAWNGTRSGQDLPIGAYSYVVRIIHKSSGRMYKKPITGSVTILR